MTELTRRKVLLSSAALGAAGVAGCVGDSDGDDEANAGAGNGEGDNGMENGGDESGNGSSDAEDDGSSNDGTESTGNGESAPSNITVETMGTECASDENDSVTIDWGGDVITVTGATPAPDPCHEAVLEDGTIKEDSFTIAIDVAEANEGDACQSCVGKIDYEARIEPENPDDISEGTVRHVQGGSHGVAVEDGSEENVDPSLGEASLETVDAGCLSGEREWTVQVWRTEDGLSIDGLLETPNPCHRAVLNDVSMTDGTLAVDVGAESTLGDNEACAQCIAEVQYVADVAVSNADGLSRVVVDHPGSESVSVAADEIEPKDEGSSAGS